MISWDELYKRLGFKNEKHMWKMLKISLRNVESIAQFLGVSENTVRIRMRESGIGTMKRSGYRKQGEAKRDTLQKLSSTIWQNKNDREIADMVGCSTGYVYKMRRRLGM